MKRHYPEDYEAASREGRVEGRAQDIVTILEARDVEVSDVIRKRILSCRSLNQLNQWLKACCNGQHRGRGCGSLDLPA